MLMGFCSPGQQFLVQFLSTRTHTPFAVLQVFPFLKNGGERARLGLVEILLCNNTPAVLGGKWGRGARNEENAESSFLAGAHASKNWPNRKARRKKPPLGNILKTWLRTPKWVSWQSRDLKPDLPELQVSVAFSPASQLKKQMYIPVNKTQVQASTLPGCTVNSKSAAWCPGIYLFIQ